MPGTKATTKTQEHAAVEKPPTKPGRKPLTSEPKNKRTAQNRAAQRAFRERKERRMLELEEKVKALEEEKVQIANESELLRMQVKTLMKKLGKANDDAEVEFDNSVDLGNPDPVRSDSFSDRSQANLSSNSSISSTTPGSSNSGEDVYHFPKLNGISSTSNNNTLLLRDKLNNKSYKDHYDEQIFCQELGGVCGNSKNPNPKIRAKNLTSASSSPTNLFTSASSLTSPSLISNSDLNLNSKSNTFKSPVTMNTQQISSDQRILSNLGTSSISTSNSLFGESPENLDNVAGQTNSIWTVSSGLDSYAFLDSNPSKNDEMNFIFDNENKVIDDTNNLIQSKPEAFQLDINSALFNYDNDSGNDLDEKTSIDKGNNNSDIRDLLVGIDFNNDNNEEDDDDVFKDLMKLSDETNNNTQSLSNPTGEIHIQPNSLTSFEDNEKVPDTTKNMMPCSQIWERIASHPRFTDLDIDNLCDELKQKAKCSESGVVVDGKDVGKLLRKVTCEKQKQQDVMQLDDKIKRSTIKGAATDTSSYLSGLW